MVQTHKHIHTPTYANSYINTQLGRAHFKQIGNFNVDLKQTENKLTLYLYSDETGDYTGLKIK